MKVMCLQQRLSSQFNFIVSSRHAVLVPEAVVKLVRGEYTDHQTYQLVYLYLLVLLQCQSTGKSVSVL
jgi:hypothetical protein